MTNKSWRYALATYLLNICDLLFTIHALNNGATELNPFMQSIHVQIIFKVFIVGVLCILCWWLGRKNIKTAILGLKITTAVYAVLVFYRISMITIAHIF